MVVDLPASNQQLFCACHDVQPFLPHRCRAPAQAAAAYTQVVESVIAMCGCRAQMSALLQSTLGQSKTAVPAIVFEAGISFPRAFVVAAGLLRPQPHCHSDFCSGAAPAASGAPSGPLRLTMPAWGMRDGGAASGSGQYRIRSVGNCNVWYHAITVSERADRHQFRNAIASQEKTSRAD
jgi:hypothetical protein